MVILHISTNRPVTIPPVLINAYAKFCSIWLFKPPVSRRQRHSGGK
jgi:hypothetical protein